MSAPSAIIDLGAFVYGDEGTDVAIKLTDRIGRAYDLSAATGLAVVCRTARGETLTITGTPAVDDDDEVEYPSLVILEGIGALATPSPARPTLNYIGHAKWEVAGEPFFSRDRVSFAIELFP